jgi:hypothetical protein
VIANPNAKPSEIVETLAKQRITITEGVASNYQSVIRSKAKGDRKRRSKPGILAASVTAATNGTIHGFDPVLVEHLKVGRSLGWDRVRSVAELMKEKQRQFF